MRVYLFDIDGTLIGSRGAGRRAFERACARVMGPGMERAGRRAGRAIDRREIWVIGDTPRDVAAAHHAGVRAIGVATGPHDVDALARSGADVVHETLAGFLDGLDLLGS